MEIVENLLCEASPGDKLLVASSLSPDLKMKSIKPSHSHFKLNFTCFTWCGQI